MEKLKAWRKKCSNLWNKCNSGRLVCVTFIYKCKMICKPEQNYRKRSTWMQSICLAGVVREGEILGDVDECALTHGLQVKKTAHLKVIVPFFYDICSVFMAATYALAGTIIWCASGWGLVKGSRVIINMKIALKHRRERFGMSFAYTMVLCSNKLSSKM